MSPLDAMLEQLAERVAAIVLERIGERLPAATPAAAPLLTKQATAAALGTSTATVDRLVRDSRIPFVKVGDVRRFDLAAVRAALATEPATPAPTAAPAVRLLSKRSK